MLFGSRFGLFVAGVGSAALIVFRPTFIAVSGILACFAMLTGFLLAYKLVSRNQSSQITEPSTRRTLVALTAGGVIFRTWVMAVQNYFVLPYAIPGLSQSALLSGVIPLVAVFNMTEPLYVIPASYLLAKVIGSNLKIGNKI